MEDFLNTDAETTNQKAKNKKPYNKLNHHTFYGGKKYGSQTIAKQIVDFNKAAFDNSFDAMSALQDQAEKMFTATMEQTSFFPAEGENSSMNG
jgi:hypothetical protein